MTVEEFLEIHPDEDVDLQVPEAVSCWITDRSSACWEADR